MKEWKKGRGGVTIKRANVRGEKEYRREVEEVKGNRDGRTVARELI
jgi:hypothetical protein